MHVSQHLQPLIYVCASKDKQTTCFSSHPGKQLSKHVCYYHAKSRLPWNNSLREIFIKLNTYLNVLERKVLCICAPLTSELRPHTGNESE
jgi:hypothetical protein